MHMSGLKTLHARMKVAGSQRAKFQIAHNHLTFDCLFLTDIAPYEFVMAAIGHQDLALVYTVQRGYMIDPTLDNADYTALAKALSQGKFSQNPFNPAQFLAQINAKIPTQYQLPSATDVVSTYRHRIEEGHKPYFKGWLLNPGKKKPEAPNLAKTLRCFGQHVHDACKRSRTSSCWTNDPNKAKPYTSPPTRHKEP